MEWPFGTEFLRDNVYADFLHEMVGADGIIRGPAGQGRVAPVAQDDIADAASGVLIHAREHAGATYGLTGPDALTLDELGAVLSTALGRSAPARSAVRFSKSCAVPPGAITSEPFGASIHAPPTKKLIVPSITKKTSSSSCV